MGGDEFFDLLVRDWKLMRTIETPQLDPAVTNGFYYFERKTRLEKILESHRADMLNQGEIS